MEREKVRVFLENATTPLIDEIIAKIKTLKLDELYIALSFISGLGI